MVKYMVI